ncbi:MAG: hypothetical protein PHD55_08310 [Methanoregula sp.]|nr:hypothetical protein [Methanoregula sp.]
MYFILRQEKREYTMQRPRAVFLFLAGSLAAVLVAGFIFLGTGSTFPSAGFQAAAPALANPGGTGTGLHDGRLVMPSLPRFYRDTVPEGTGRQWVNLSWADPEKPRALLIYSPEGTLGPYYNSFNGITDQRISLFMEQDTGLSAGPWYYEVTAGSGAANNNQSFAIVREPTAGECEGI